MIVQLSYDKYTTLSILYIELIQVSQYTLNLKKWEHLKYLEINKPKL